MIAVDGPSGAGKSSAARGAARALGLRYLDTGAMYRAMTWWMLQYDVPVDDPAAVAAFLSSVPGVVEHGLFPPSMVSDVIVARGTDVEHRRIG